MKLLKTISCFGIGIAIGFEIAKKFFKSNHLDMDKEELEREKAMSKKHLDLFLLSNQWVRVYQSNNSIVDYMQHKGYNKVAIYGMSYLGDTLLEEFKQGSIDVIYGIDKNADEIYSSIKVVKPSDELAKVDAVIVTTISAYEEIASELCVKLDCPILSLENIIYEIQY